MRFAARLSPQALLGPCQSAEGYYVGNWFTPRRETTPRAFKTLSDLILSDELLVDIGARLSLPMAGEAHRIMESRLANGRIVLKPWADSAAD